MASTAVCLAAGPGLRGTTADPDVRGKGPYRQQPAAGTTLRLAMPGGWPSQSDKADNVVLEQKKLVALGRHSRAEADRRAERYQHRPKQVYPPVSPGDSLRPGPVEGRCRPARGRNAP